MAKPHPNSIKWRLKKMDQSSQLLKLPKYELVHAWNTRLFRVELRYQSLDRIWRCDILMGGKSLNTYKCEATPGIAIIWAIYNARKILMWPPRLLNRGKELQEMRKFLARIQRKVD